MCGIICYLVIRSILIGTRIKKHKDVFWLNEVVNFLFVLYLCLVGSVTLFPIPIGIPSDPVYDHRSINLIPLVSIMKNVSQIGIAYGGDSVFMIELIIRNVGGNILLLMPFGFLAPIVWISFKYFKKTLLFGLGISICIEVLQLVESLEGGWGRITDIDDVICNVIGVMIGFFIYRVTFKIVEKYQIKILQRLNSKGSILLVKDNKIEI